MLRKIYGKNEIIFREGSIGSDLYVVVSGKAKVYKEIKGREFELAILEKGDVFGEMGLLMKIARTATIIALENTEVVTFDKEDLKTEIKKDPELAIVMMTQLANRILDGHAIISNIEGEKKALQVMFSHNEGFQINR